MVWGDIFFWPFAAGVMALQLIIGLIVLAFVVWMIIDCAQRKFKNNGEKIIWIVLLILTTWVGAIAYYIAIRALNPRGLSKK